MKSNQQGFTLIELIIVIVILGILAVTASPKFLDLQGDAKASTVQGLSASLKSASNIVYSKALVQGKANAPTETTSSPDISVVFGYPQADVATMQAILDINSKATTDTTEGTDWEISVDATNNVVRLYPTGDYDAGTNAFEPAEACFVEYTEATATDSPATVTTTTSGC